MRPRGVFFEERFLRVSVGEILLSHEVNLDDTFDVIAKFSVTKGEQSHGVCSYLLQRAHLISSMQAVEYTGSK